MPFYPYSNMAIIGSILAVVVLMALYLGMAVPVLIGVGWVVGLVAIYVLVRVRRGSTPA